MKSGAILLTVLILMFTANLFSQVNTPPLKIEKRNQYTHFFQHNHLAEKDNVLFNFAEKRQIRNNIENNSLSGYERLNYAPNSDELIYVCDSAITYNSLGDKTLTINTRDAGGRITVELTQDWDGVKWVNVSKWSTTYNSSGNWILDIFQDWDTQSGNWVNTLKVDYTYDSSEKMLMQLYLVWDFDTDNWVNDFNRSYNYDSSGNLLSTIDQTWDINIDEWANIEKRVFTYDTNRNKLSELEENWNTGINDWVNHRIYHYSYDTLGNMLSMFYQDWNTSLSEWRNEWQYLYTYNGFGSILSGIAQQWKNNNWSNYSKVDLAYDESNYLISEARQNWFGGDWLNSTRIEFNYNAYGQAISDLYLLWSSNVEEWGNYEKRSYSYDEGGNKLLELLEHWNYVNNYWVNMEKIEYVYDDTMNKIVSLSYEWSGEWLFVDYNRIDIEFEKYILFSGYNCHKVELWYSSYVSAIGDESNLQPVNASFCSPNPANSFIEVNNPYEKSAVLKIYNIVGLPIKEFYLNHGKNSVSIKNLQQGVYLFTIRCDQNVSSNKVMIY